MPLQVTPWGVSRLDDQLIWPVENELDIAFEQLLNSKQERNKAIRDGYILAQLSHFLDLINSSC